MVTIDEIMQMAYKHWCNVRPILAVIWAGICWVIFPVVTYMYAAMAVAVSIMLDIFTKYYYLSGGTIKGYFQAVREKRINSETLWQKTSVKIVSFLVVMIMAGLAYRVAPLGIIANGLATVIYSVMFLREFQSIIENLIDAGAKDLEWLLFWLKRKEAAICEEQNACSLEEIEKQRKDGEEQ